MFENIMNFFKKFSKKDKNKESSSAAKERLHLVLMQDRANVSADFLELMRQEIIEVIKKYIDIDEKAIDVKLTNKMNEDGTVGAPALYANIPIVTIKNEARKVEVETKVPQTEKQEENSSVNKNEEKKEHENKKTEKIEQEKEIKQEDKKEVVVEQKEKKQENVTENKVEEKNKETEKLIGETTVTEEKEQEHTEKQDNKPKVEAN